jgi:hypothetical protein
VIRFAIWATLFIAAVVGMILQANSGPRFDGGDLLLGILLMVSIWKLATLPDRAATVDDTTTKEQQ